MTKEIESQTKKTNGVGPAVPYAFSNDNHIFSLIMNDFVRSVRDFHLKERNEYAYPLC
jgi:hypothetical protein